MAKKSEAIDAETTYRVKLKRAIKVGRTLLRPRDGLKIKGVHLQAHIDAVESYEAV